MAFAMCGLNRNFRLRFPATSQSPEPLAVIVTATVQKTTDKQNESRNSQYRRHKNCRSNFSREYYKQHFGRIRLVRKFVLSRL